MAIERSLRLLRKSVAMLTAILAVELVAILAAANVSASPNHDWPPPPSPTSIASPAAAGTGTGNPVVASAGATRLPAFEAAQTRMGTLVAASTPVQPAIPKTVSSHTAGTFATKAAVAPKAASRTAAALSGRNHIWSSAFGFDDPVVAFSCTRSAPPTMHVYRWGCAGPNNIYLFAHAGGPFWGLNNAYTSGRLKKGQEVVYADGAGTVHRFRVALWKVVSPNDAGWAIAAQSQSSMTLQTCVGTHSQSRLIVRLYESN